MIKSTNMLKRYSYRILNKGDEFYPTLRKTAGSNQRLKELLDAFDKDMDEITRYSIEFLGDYTAAAGSELALELKKVHCKP